MLAMLGLSIYTTIQLTTRWLNTGRFEGKMIDVVELEGVYPPSLVFKPEAASCGISAFACTAFLNGTKSDCEKAIVEYGGEFCKLLGLNDSCSPRRYCQQRAINGTYAPVRDICLLAFRNSVLGFDNHYAQKNDIVMRTSLDTLNINLYINEKDCAKDIEFQKSSQAVFMFAARSYKKSKGIDDTEFTQKSVTAPIPIGLGHIAFINYNIEQEKFINGSIVNSTELQTTQYRRIVPSNTTFENYMVLLDFKVSRFTAVRTIHIPGQSWIDLFGGIFGWWGVLTGACILTFFDTMNSIFKKVHKEGKILMEEPESEEGVELAPMDIPLVANEKEKSCPTFTINVGSRIGGVHTSSI